MKKILFFLFVTFTCIEVYAQDDYRVVYRDQYGRVVSTASVEPYVLDTTYHNIFDFYIDAGYSMRHSGKPNSGFHYGIGGYINIQNIGIGMTGSMRHYYSENNKPDISVGYLGILAFRYYLPDATASNRWNFGLSVGLSTLSFADYDDVNYISGGAGWGATVEASRDFKLTKKTSLTFTVRYLMTQKMSVTELDRSSRHDFDIGFDLINHYMSVNAIEFGLGVRF